MGTRCITVVTHDWDNGEVIHDASIYRHWDGYPDGHGRWLADFLKDTNVTNGKIDGAKNFNGPGRLASGIVAALIKDEHDPSLQEQGLTCGQEFEYHIHVKYGMKGGTISIKVFDGPMTMFGGGGGDCTNEVFNGTVEEFEMFVRLAELPVNEETAA